MGFEVKFNYCERMEDGNYSSEVKEMKKKVGEPFDDTSLDILMQRVMAQYARRDILVKDVEVYELTKKKLNFRETKGGFIIKNKKFMFDAENNTIISQDIPEQQTTALVPHNQPNGSKRPIKWVIIDEAGITIDANGNRLPVPLAIKQAGLQFRLNQRYPVYQELDDPRDKRVDRFGQPTLDRKKVFMMWDDQKRDVMVSQDYFAPADINLVADRELGFTKQSKNGNGPKLMFEDGDESAGMPELRR